ncbi:Gfo/Idh/MocA family protein [Novosphingobium umbonatum]|nr:Gfo/Idh/MocA family oxidoreductase [Novosphingobium umbonatum]
MTQRWGVGLVGSGLVTRSIHIPALAALGDLFALRSLWDVNPALAQATAASCGAQAAPSLEAMLADPAIDVVMIGSPAQFHAGQAIAALRAGKKAVLVEKPLCSTPQEAEDIAQVARETGGLVLVGAMHLFDPAWRFMEQQVAAQDSAPSLIRSCIILPPNGRFDQWASEEILPPPPAGSPPLLRSEVMMMEGAIMGLAIHDLPLVRRLLRDDAGVQVTSAKRLSPFGYMLSIKAGEQLVDLFAFMHGHWRPEWTLTATALDWQAHAEFTPSFVMAGSGSASFTAKGASHAMIPQADNGYAGEWQAIAAFLSGEAAPPDPQDVVRDFLFAHAIAQQACALVAKEMAQ